MGNLALFVVGVFQVFGIIGCFMGGGGGA